MIIAHNKTLAAQLYGEMKEFFPENAVEYFVSYYDYYQPEAYVPSTDTYIAKDSAINDEIDKLRLSATASLVGTEGCHYCGERFLHLRIWAARMIIRRWCFLCVRAWRRTGTRCIRKLIDIQYDRNDMDFHRGTLPCARAMCWRSFRHMRTSMRDPGRIFRR